VSSDQRRWPLLLRRLIASDRVWIFASSMFSRISNFLCNVILARYGGPAVLGTYSATLGTATATVSPLVWSLSTSATLGTRGAPDEPTQRAVIAAHVYWALLIACGSSAGFLILQAGADVGGVGAPHAALSMLIGLVVVVSMLVTAVLQAALHGLGVYKPVARRLIAVSVACVLVAIPAVLALGLAGALLTLGFQYALLPIALAYLARPSARERARVRAAFRAATRQLVQSLPNLAATLIAAAAYWLTMIFLFHRSHGVAGIGVQAVGTSWLTIEMMPVAAWGGLSLRVLSEARATSPAAFRSAIRRILWKDVTFTLAIASLVFLCAAPLSSLYGMADTPLPTILRINSVTALVMAATQAFERSMFCAGQQKPWLRARAIGSLCMLALAWWLVPMRLEHAAIALLCGYCTTAAICVFYLLRGRDRLAQ